MYLGFGSLVNPQAIALTRSNAYQAARIVLGTSAPMAQAMKAAQDYTNFILPKLNRAATVPQILGDLDFTRFIAAAKEASDTSIEHKIASAEKMIGGIGIGDSLAFGIPNWILYGGLAAGGYFYWKKKKSSGFKLFSKPAAASGVPTATTTVKA